VSVAYEEKAAISLEALVADVNYFCALTTIRSVQAPLSG
jgi:hypothetical protein